MNLVNMLYIFILIGMFFFVVGGIIEGVKYVFKIEPDVDRYNIPGDNRSIDPDLPGGGDNYNYQPHHSMRDMPFGHKRSNRRHNEQ